MWYRFFPVPSFPQIYSSKPLRCFSTPRSEAWGNCKVFIKPEFSPWNVWKRLYRYRSQKNVVQYCLSGSIKKTEGNHWKINISSTNTHKIICFLFNIKWNIKIKYTFVHVLKNYGILHSLIKQVVLHDKNKWEEEEQNLQKDRSHRAGFACQSATSYGHTEPRVTG